MASCRTRTATAVDLPVWRGASKDAVLGFGQDFLLKLVGLEAEGGVGPVDDVGWLAGLCSLGSGSFGLFEGLREGLVGGVDHVGTLGNGSFGVRRPVFRVCPDAVFRLLSTGFGLIHWAAPRRSSGAGNARVGRVDG
mgnify:CR=1 FL=1